MMRQTGKRSWLALAAALALVFSLPVSGSAQTAAQVQALQNLALVHPHAGSPGTEATNVGLDQPAALAFDAAGNLYIADQLDQLVLKVDTAGVITTVAGTGTQGYAGDGSAASSALLNLPGGVIVDGSGNLYIADTGNNVVRKVDSFGTITTIAATVGVLSGPTALAVDGSGNLYIADTQNSVVRKLVGGTLTIVAGTGVQGFGGDSNAATSALLDTPTGLAVSATTLYIADTNNNRIRAVNLVSGVITTIAGDGTASYGGDNAAATGAQLDKPAGLALDASGNLYVADSDNNRVRKISGGTITTFAGTGAQGYSGDNGLATTANLDTPLAVAAAPGGGIAVADSDNDRVRVVSPSGALNTGAGKAAAGVEGLQLTNTSPAVVYGTASITATFSNGSNVATGSAIFTDLTTGAPLGSAVLTTNVATLALPALPAGVHQIVATYPGDSNNAPVTSGVYILTVTKVAVTATANSVSQPYGTAIPVLTGTLTGVLTQDAATATAVYATTAIQTSAPGTYPITRSLTGSTAANYTLTLSGTSGSFAITKASSTNTLTATPTTQFQGVAVVLKATLASTTTGTPTGSVTFFDGATSLGTVVLTSGVAQLSVSNLSVGTHTLTANYAGDTNFQTSIGTAAPSETILVDPDFALATSTSLGGGASQVVVPGAGAVFGFTASPVNGSFTSPITFTAAGLPAGATAAFSPTSVTPGANPANFTMSVSTAKTTVYLKTAAGGSMALALLLLPFAQSRRMRKASKRLARLTLLLLLAVSAGALSGCGSGGFFGQPSATSIITVTGTATNVAGQTVQHSVTVTLTVQ